MSFLLRPRPSHELFPEESVAATLPEARHDRLLNAQASAAHRIVMYGIIAQGGVAAIAKLQTAQRSCSGTQVVRGVTVPVTGSETWQVLPFQYRMEQNLENFPRTRVIVNLTSTGGSKGWQALGRQPFKPFGGQELASAAQQLEVEGLDLLLPILYNGAALKPAGDTTVAGQAVRGVDVTLPTGAAATLYFARKSGLYLVRRSQQNGEVREVLYSDYQEQDGVLAPRRLQLRIDRKVVSTLQVDDLKLFDYLPNKTFTP